MLNGWFTIAAQAVNFLILVGLLKHFLYKPILSAIDQREKGIAAQLASAVAKQADAQKEQDDFKQKNEAFDQQRASLLTKATDDAKTERQKLIDQAHKDADALTAKRQAGLQAEQKQLNQEILSWTQKQVFAIARKTLADLSAPSLEEAMSESFIGRLKGLAGLPKEQLTLALGKQPGPAVVRSAIELPAAQKSKIEAAIQQTFRPTIPITFQTVPEVISGVELSANGQKVSWTIANYLATLEQSAGDLLKTNQKTEFNPPDQPKAAEQPLVKPRPNGKPVVTIPKRAS
jgi:F-type H+-transporting ATPase subunit b